jgi:hypothetical protein
VYRVLVWKPEEKRPLGKPDIDGMIILRCVRGWGEVCTGFWCGNLKEKDHCEETDIDGKII